MEGPSSSPRARPPHTPTGGACTPVHTRTDAPRCARLTYGGERHKSLDEKAGGRGELVGFLNQDIKAHLRKRKQKECVVLQRPMGGRGTTLPWNCTPDPASSA